MKIKRKKVGAVFLLIILCSFFVSVAVEPFWYGESVQADTMNAAPQLAVQTVSLEQTALQIWKKWCGITDKDKCYTADIFSCRGSDFGGRQAVSPVFSETAADTYRGQPGDYLLYS